MPSFIPTGQKLDVLSNFLWSNNQQALFGIATPNTDLNSGPQTSVQCFAIVQDATSRPDTMTIYLLVNTQFKSINENAENTEQVELKNCEIKISRSFDLSKIHSGELNYSQLHALGKSFAHEVLKHAQFALFSELGKIEALPLSIYEGLIFNPENIDLKADSVEGNEVNLSPFIHYYQLLNLPRITLIDKFVEFAEQKGEMTFTKGAMRFYLSEPPCLNLMQKYKNITAEPVNLRNQDLFDLHKASGACLQEIFKSVLYDLTLNNNNRNSHEYELFRSLLHCNGFNEITPNNIQPNEDLISDLLDQAKYTALDFGFAERCLDKIGYNSKTQHFYENLKGFKETLGHIQAAIESCCHVYTHK